MLGPGWGGHCGHGSSQDWMLLRLGEYVMPMAFNAGELSGGCEWEIGAALEELGVGKRACSKPESPEELCFSLLILKVGHEPMPPTLGTNVLGRKVLYLPSFFTYGEYGAQARKPMPIEKRPSVGPGAPARPPGTHSWCWR